MTVTLPTPGETNWDVPLNGALTDLDSAITTIGNLANAIPAIQARINGETFYRLVASSQASTNVKNKADFVCTGTADQVQIQAAVDAAFAEGGGIVQLTSGSFLTTAPITLHPLVHLVGPHGDQIMNPGQFTSAASIKPQASFTGGAVIVLLDQTGGGYAHTSSEQRISSLTIDGSTSAAAVHGIQGGGAITSVTIRDVTIRQVTGKGIYTFFQNSSQPFSWTFEGVLVDNSVQEGFHLINHTDFTMLDCISIGAGATGYLISNAPNSRMIGCRAEWSDNNGIYLTGNFGTGQGSGGMLINACSTDRNANNGILIDALGNGPVNIVGCMTRRDGRNNNVGGGGYAGIKVLNATMPVVVSGWTNYVGVDDNGTGVDSPVYAASATGASSVQIDDSYMHGATSAMNDDGTNTILRVGNNVVYATGVSSAPVRTVPSSSSTGPDWYNVKDYGADGNGVSDDTAPIQAAVNAAFNAGGGVVYIPTGTYKLTAAITLKNRVTVRGDGDYVTNIVQSSTTANGFVGSSLIYTVIEHLRLTGPGSGSGSGMQFDTEFDYAIIRDVSATNWGSTGIIIEQPIVSNLTRVTSFSNGGAGFYIHGNVSTGAGTSVSFNSCWAHDNISNGFSFQNMTYCAMVACAADNQNQTAKSGYLVDGCTGFTFTGCGSEGNNFGWEFTGASTGMVITSPFIYNTPATGIGVWVTGGSTNVQIFAATEVSPQVGAAAFIKVDSGCSATIQGAVQTTANVLAANTTVIAANSSGTRSYPNGLSTTALNMNSGKITSLANGTIAADAVNYGQLSARSVSVKDYGAVGDGTTNDAPAIQSALSSLTAGGTLFFPPGNYLVNNAAGFPVQQPVQIVGAGPGATSIRIGSSFTDPQLFNVTSNDVTFRDIQIRGNSTVTTSNPAADAILATAVQTFKMFNVELQWINGYGVKVFGTAAGTIHGGQIDNCKIQSCAGGIYIKGDHASGNTAANFQISNLFTRFLGVNSGGSANLDGIRIEDAWDVLMSNNISWMQQTLGGTGSALRIHGDCAAIFITNLDALGPQTGTANVIIEDSANGTPQNIQITGGVIQQGLVGLLIAGATNQVRVSTVRFINNQGHGVSVTGTGFGINIDRSLFSLNGQAATGTNYEINWSGTATGFVTFCRFASPIVTTGTAGVQFSINVAAAQNVRILDADFQGTGAAQANWVTNFPQILSHVDGTNYTYFGTVVFAFSGAGNVALQPSTTTNNVLSSNTAGADAFDRFRLRGDGRFDWGPGNAARDTNLYRSGVGALTTDTFFAMGSGQSGGQFSIFGNTAAALNIGSAGGGIQIKTGTNARLGQATLVGGTVTVSNTSVTANTRVFLSRKTIGGTAGFLTYTLTAGTSFTITSANGADTSVVDWLLVEAS